MKNLLLLHGALSTQNQFDDFALYLKKNHKVNALTFRGHGNNQKTLSGHFFDDYNEDILSYMVQNQLSKINIFGYSMGGYAALYFASKYPNMVESIATLNTKFDWNIAQVSKETALLNADKIAEKVPAYAQHLMHIHGEQNWKTMLANTKTMMEQLAQQPILTEALLNQINCKVLIGVGDRDNTATIIENLNIFKQLPDAQFMVLPNTGHPFDKVNYELLHLLCNNFFNK